MKAFRSFIIITVLFLFPMYGISQGRELINQKGVSLSYVRETLKYCEETKSTIYKIIAYLKNNSGSTITFTSNCSVYIPTGNWASTPDCGSPFQPTAFFGAPVNWPNNSTLSEVCYMKVPDGGTIPEPGYILNSWTEVENKTTNPVKQPTPEPQWTDWKTSGCYKGLSYQYKVTELYNLNLQVHYEFKVRSSYNETVEFIMSLRDQFDKERFGTKYTIPAGGEITFTEKMSENYIKSTIIDKAWFPEDVGKKPSLCDGVRENEKQSKSDNAELIRKLQSIITATPFPTEEKRKEYQGKLNSIINYTIDEEKRHSYLLALENELDYVSKGAYAFKAEKDKVLELKGINDDLSGRIKAKLEKLPVISETSGFHNDLQNADYIKDNEEIRNKKLLALEEKIKEFENAKAQKEEQSKKENGDMVLRIKEAISSFPVEARRIEFQNELTTMLNLQVDETTRSPYLVALENKINSQAAQIKANQETFKADSDKRTEEINANREKNQDIKKQQTELTAAYSAYGAAIFALRRKSGKGVRYEGPSHKFSLRPGLQVLNMPVGYISHDQGSQYNTSTGGLNNFHNRTFTEGSMLTPGMFLGAEYHPVYSNVFSLGFTIDASIGYWPNANDGATTTTTNYAGNSSNIYMNLGYGAELTMGAKPIKLLARFHMENPLVNVSSSTSTTSQYGVYSSQSETWYQSEQAWKNTWAAAGIRIGNYEKARTYIDLAYTRYISTKCTVTDEGKFTSDYKLTNLFTAPATGKVPSGFYLMFAQQNGLFVRGEYIKSSVLVNEQTGTFSNASKAYFNIIIGSSMDWFGSPKKHK